MCAAGLMVGSTIALDPEMADIVADLTGTADELADYDDAGARGASLVRHLCGAGRAALTAAPQDKPLATRVKSSASIVVYLYSNGRLEHT